MKTMCWARIPCPSWIHWKHWTRLTYQSPFTTYPDTEFGLALKQTAMLIKAEVGLEVSAIDVGGWDTHFAQGSTSGLMPNLMKDLAEGLAAFHADMLDIWRI